MTLATSPLSPARVMHAAWARLRKHYAGATFREIGRAGFAECLRWAWARARVMATLVARGPALLKVELAEVSRRMVSADRAAGARSMSPAFSRSMLDERRILAIRERWLRSAIAFHPIAG